MMFGAASPLSTAYVIEACIGRQCPSGINSLRTVAVAVAVAVGGESELVQVQFVVGDDEEERLNTLDNSVK
jgi:hypothetical protein